MRCRSEELWAKVEGHSAAPIVEPRPLQMLGFLCDNTWNLNLLVPFMGGNVKDKHARPFLQGHQARKACRRLTNCTCSRALRCKSSAGAATGEGGGTSGTSCFAGKSLPTTTCNARKLRTPAPSRSPPSHTAPFANSHHQSVPTAATSQVQ